MTTDPVLLSPLLPDDPAKVGDFWLDARLTSTSAGVGYVAHDDAAVAVMLIMLSEGAAADAGARDRLAGTVNKMHIDTVYARGGEGQDTGRLANRFRAEDDDPMEPGATPQAPWVALRYDGSPEAVAEANRILDEVQLAKTPPVGQPAGPEYQLHWINRFAPGSTRLWPLPWPGRHDRAGFGSILASWLLMLLLAALAILLAILLFQQSPPESPPPPVPTSAAGGETSGPPDTAQPTPTPSSSSNPASASPTNSSAGGDPTEDSRL
ncbi:MAG: hypothetical protein LBR58_07865 [Propionibacteriaceae bacterium]|jgi:hypothetical protein|nr:hypothetical protein [Propionibacteriaceae bacterium]